MSERGVGFVPPDGDLHADIAFMGEAPGYDEAAIGRPFVGAAGSMLERILRRLRLNRGQFRIGNVISCCPPGLLLDKMPYQQSAIQHCAVHRDKLLNEGHKVVVALGGTALRTLLGLHGVDRIRVEEFHGTVHRDRENRFWVVPTFHTSFLQRGAHHLIGTVAYDLQVAMELARGQWTEEPLDLVIDPAPDWFEAWVALAEAAALQDPEGLAIACDIETPDKAGGKPENELTPEDDSYQILRFNCAVHPDQGVTVPYEGPYIPLIDRLLRIKARHYWWNGYGYDWARIWAAGHTMAPEWQLDMMVAAHVLQSDVPLGLGFWAPFYSRYGAWKHRSLTDPEQYACIDGPQTWRVGSGIIGDLIQAGQWRAFQEDCHELYYGALKPAQDLGILIDRPALEGFHQDLATKQRRLLHEMQGYVDDALRPLTHETREAPGEGILHPSARTHTLRGELKKDAPDPLKQDLYALAAVQVSRQVSRLIQVCTTCGQVEVAKTHRCHLPNGKIDASRTPALTLEERLVERWFWQEPFNPDSSKQILAYIRAHHHKPGKNKYTREDSADRDTLVRLAGSTKDPFYKVNLDYRAIKKVDSTYALPAMRRVDKEIAEGREPRLHPIPTFRPSMQRLSYISPNITNVVADKDDKRTLAGGFRRCVVAAPGCRLLEVDFAGIEPHEVGYFMRDPTYIRLARLGSHAFIASHILKRPADLRWSDSDLATYLLEIKHHEKTIYDKCKRTNNGINYGLTPFGMVNTFPDIYKDLKDAEAVTHLIYDLFPTMPTWHGALRQQAYDTGFLGGPGVVLQGADNSCYKPGWTGPSPWAHPFQYRHWFWSVLAYKPITESQRLRRQKARKPTVEINGRWFAVEWGEDSKRCIAFFPQSTAAGVLKRSIRALFCYPDHPSYIGDAYYGRTPFRAPIHDSLLLEVPDRQWDRVLECVGREMLRPVQEQPLPESWGMGSHLSIGIDAKGGRNWLETESVLLPRFSEVGAGEDTYFGVEEMDEEDTSELGVVA